MELSKNRRYLTTNFVFNREVSANDQSAISQWRTARADEGIRNIAYDNKNGIYCANPTFDYECYYNYMTLLNQLNDRWVNYARFDQGYKPLVYLPSFWANPKITEDMLTLASCAGVSLEKVKGTGLLKPFTGGPGCSEYWVKNVDLSRIMEYAKQKFEENYGVPPTGKYDYGPTDPIKVRPIRLVKVNMEIQRDLRAIAAEEGI